MRAKLIIKGYVGSNLRDVSLEEKARLSDDTFYPGALLDCTIHISAQDEKALAENIRRGFYLVSLINVP